MTNRYHNLIDAFEIKLRKLILEYKLLQEQNNALLIKLDDKQNELMHAHKQILELRKDYDHLRIARNIGFDETSRNESKKKINNIVREIDKCIALLDE